MRASSSERPLKDLQSRQSANLPAFGYNASQLAVIQAAQGWMAKDALVIDTETTGLGDDAEILEITVMTLGGRVLLDTLVRPTRPIPPESSQLHGIDDAQVANAPSWAQVHELFWSLVRGRDLLFYGMTFDYRVLANTAARHGLKMPGALAGSNRRVRLADGTVLHCLMRAYAMVWQEPHQRGRDSWRWKALDVACMTQGIQVGGAHRARADCEMALALVEAIARGPDTWAGSHAIAS